MLCSKCHENIPQGKETQIKGTIICKECISFIEKESKGKAVARCWNCNQFLYKGDLIHESLRSNSKNFSKWFSIGLESSEKLFHCDECYQEWRSDVKKAKSLSRLKFVLLGFCSGYSLFLVLDLFFPEIAKRLDNNFLSVITLFVLLFIFINVLRPILDADQYKFRKKLKSKKK